MKKKLLIIPVGFKQPPIIRGYKPPKKLKLISILREKTNNIFMELNPLLMQFATNKRKMNKAQKIHMLNLTFYYSNINELMEKHCLKRKIE